MKKRQITCTQLTGLVCTAFVCFSFFFLIVFGYVYYAKCASHTQLFSESLFSVGIQSTLNSHIV